MTPDAIEGELRADSFPTPSGDTGPVPKGNRPGSQSGPVQDKPDLDAMAKKLGAHKADPSTGQLDTSHPDAPPTPGTGPLRPSSALVPWRSVRLRSPWSVAVVRRRCPTR